MNWDTIEGKWKQLTGSVKEKWGDLTDNDLMEIDGKKDKLVGKVQEKYGMTRDKAEQAIDSWATRSEQPDWFGNAWRNTEGNWHEAKGKFKQKFGELADDPITESHGKREALAGMVQKQYNLSRGDALEMVDEWAHGEYPVPGNQRPNERQ